MRSLRYVLTATACLVATAPLLALAAGAGAWQAAPAPAVHRSSDHTATLLRDGRVLVVGGLSPNPKDIAQDYSTGATTAAEILDPARGLWTSAGSLAVARQYHTATLLADGRVLVVGGYRRTSRIADDLVTAAEMYDPSSGGWSPAGSLATGRIGHTATLLRDGRVLVAGGLALEPTKNNPGQLAATDTAELYDPRTGSWTTAGTMKAGRWEHAATLLDDGKVLLTGGRNTPGGAVPAADGVHADTAHALQDAVIFEPGSGTWSTVPHLMATRRTAHTATLLGDGSVLVAGGSTNQDHGGGGTPTQAAEIYVPRTQLFITAKPMLQARFAHTATSLSDGRVLVVGGQGARLSGVIDPVPSAELYLPATGQWVAAAGMAAAADTAHDRLMRLWLLGGHHTATLLSGATCGGWCGRVLVIGGDDTKAAAQLFDPTGGATPTGSTWTARATEPPVLAGAGAALALLVALGLWRLRARHRRNAW